MYIVKGLKKISWGNFKDEDELLCSTMCVREKLPLCDTNINDQLTK